MINTLGSPINQESDSANLVMFDDFHSKKQLLNMRNVAREFKN